MNNSNNLQFNNDSFYSVFTDENINKQNHITCRQISTYDELKQKVSQDSFIGFCFITNEKTGNTLLFDNEKAYITKNIFIKDLLNEKNIFYETHKDIENLNDLDADTFNSYDLFRCSTYEHSYNFMVDAARSVASYYYNNENRKNNLTIKEESILRRIMWMHEVLFVTPDIFKDNRDDPDPTKKTKLENLFSTKESNIPLYKEFFIDKDYSFTVHSKQSYTYSRSEIEDTYATTNLSDYKDKTYGMLINLDLIAILKKQSSSGYEMVLRNKNAERSISYNSPIHDLKLQGLLYFVPSIVKEEFTPSQTRLLEKLKNNYAKTYNRIIEGLKFFKKQQADIRPFSFMVSASSKTSLTISDIRRNDLSRIDTYDVTSSKDGIQSLFENLAAIKKDGWIILTKGCPIFINKELLKEFKYDFSFEEKSSYYGGKYLTLIVKYGRHKYRFENPTEDLIKELCTAGAFDEEKRDMLICELLLRGSK